MFLVDNDQTEYVHEMRKLGWDVANYSGDIGDNAEFPMLTEQSAGYTDYPPSKKNRTANCLPNTRSSLSFYGGGYRNHHPK